MIVSLAANGYDERMASPENDKNRTPLPGEEPPPFLGAWNRIYAVLIIYACILIVALFLMTITLNR